MPESHRTDIRFPSQNTALIRPPPSLFSTWNQSMLNSPLMCRFIPQIDLEICEFLNFRFSVRSQPCPHCYRTNFVKAHGYVRASKEAEHQPASSIRAVRFMCSARNGDSGCGMTFSIHWDHLVPRSSLESAPVSQIIETLIPHSENMSLSELAKTKQWGCSPSTAYRAYRINLTPNSPKRSPDARLFPVDAGGLGGVMVWRLRATR